MGTILLRYFINYDKNVDFYINDINSAKIIFFYSDKNVVSVLKIIFIFLLSSVVFANQVGQLYIIHKSLQGLPAYKKNNKYRIKTLESKALKKGTIFKTVEAKHDRKGYTLVEDTLTKNYYFISTKWLQKGAEINRTFNFENVKEINATVKKILMPPKPDCNEPCSLNEQSTSVNNKDDIDNEDEKKDIKNKNDTQKMADDLALKKYTSRIEKQFIISYKSRAIGLAHARAFLARVKEISKQYPITISEILSRADGESSFNPKIENKSGHVGLYQFGEAAAKDVGTSIEQILEMTPVQQLDVFIKFAKLRKHFDYASHVLPVTSGYPPDAVIGTREVSNFYRVDGYIRKRCKFTPQTFYRHNHLFDINNDGLITKEEINKYGSGIRKKG